MAQTVEEYHRVLVLLHKKTDLELKTLHTYYGPIDPEGLGKMIGDVIEDRHRKVEGSHV